MFRRLALLVGVSLVATGLVSSFPSIGTADADESRLYRVTITNVTSGQPLSPPVFVTHSRDIQVFAVGRAASAGVRAIAEDGEPGPLGQALRGAPGVRDFAVASLPVRRTGGGGPPESGTSLTVMLEAGENDVLSVVTMLVCTNDGITGVNSMPLPSGFVPVSVFGAAYDGGSEQNNELSTQIVDPCGQGLGPRSFPADGNGRVATSGVITMHPGLSFNGDMTGAHAWFGSPSQIIVERVR